MALILKPVLKKASDGKVAATVHIDNSQGHPLGIVGPSVHGSEDAAREALRAEIESHFTGLEFVIAVDGKQFEHDIDAALARVVVDTAGTPLGPHEPLENG